MKNRFKPWLNFANKLPEKLLKVMSLDRKTGCWRHSKFRTINVNGKDIYTYRFVYERLVGPIPHKHAIDHVWTRGCDGNCCNPDHLEAVTPLENALRGVAAEKERKLKIAMEIDWKTIPTPEDPDFRNTLRAWRRKHRLTQPELSQALGMNTETVSRWETGTRAPNLATPRWKYVMERFSTVRERGVSIIVANGKRIFIPAS